MAEQTTAGLTAEQSRAIDRDASERLGLPGLVLMENAGRGAAEVLERLGLGGRVVVVCGKGNNAGDGLVVARRLRVLGRRPSVVLLEPRPSMAADAQTNLRATIGLGIAVADLSALPSDDLPDAMDRLAAGERISAWVDAMLGTGTSGAPREPLRTAICFLNDRSEPRVALDVPSGLDADSGVASEPTLRADHTATFVAPKRGFANSAAEPWIGRVHVVDIGVPWPAAFPAAAG